MSAKQILIIEDEPKIAQLLQDFLSLDGYESVIVGDGALAISAFETHQPHCVILDLMLPNKDGLTICKELRAFSNVPIIMLTARVDEIDRLKGLKSGADDYVCKPFSPKEVVARVEAILRRAIQQNDESPTCVFEFNNLVLNTESYICKYEGKIVELTPVEFKLLLVLVKKPNAVFSRDQLMSHCYDDGRIVSDRTIDSHMKNVRQKLALNAEGKQPVQAVYGVGYKLV